MLNRDSVILNKIVVQAPGRVCLFGDHQDYLQLPIIACAIDRHITLIATSNDSGQFAIHMPDLGKNKTIPINNDFSTVAEGDHLMAALKVLRYYSCIPSHGYDITISGNIAINAGTSSSSAVVIAWIKFLLEAFGCSVTVNEELIAKLAYEAEVVEQGASGGRMDQYSIGLGNILYLETGEKPYYEIFKKPLPGLVVGESGIPKQTVSLLKELKGKTFLAINEIKQKLPGFELAKANKNDLLSLLNYLPENLQPFLNAAISNHDITQRALREFRKETLDADIIGALMNEHHSVLKKQLKLTVPKIDTMIDNALSVGALGAKIVGSGRGGSIALLTREGDEPVVIKALIEAGAKDAYHVSVDPGAIIKHSKQVNQ